MATLDYGRGDDPLPGLSILSDIHNKAAIVERLAYIQRYRPFDWLLITGDLTHNGATAEYEWLAHMLEYWVGRLIVVPGNHDAGLLGNVFMRRLLARFDDTFGTRFLGVNSPAVTEIIQPEGSRRGVVVIGLDSNRETWFPGDFARGRIGIWQRWKLGWDLNRYKGWTRIVALHHHPFERHPFLCLSDSRKFMAVVENSCEVLCFGHKHEQERCRAEEERYGIPYILASGASYKEDRGWRVIFDGDGFSHRVEHPRITGISLQELGF